MVVLAQDAAPRIPGFVIRRTELYTATSVIVSPRAAVDSGEYSELSDMTGLKTFVTELAGHIAAEAARG